MLKYKLKTAWRLESMLCLQKSASVDICAPIQLMLPIRLYTTIWLN